MRGMDPFRPRKGQIDTSLLRRTTFRRNVRTQTINSYQLEPNIPLFCYHVNFVE